MPTPDLSAKGIQAATPCAKFDTVAYDLHEPGPDDVVITVKYCGVCHSDVHAARDEVAPGHGKFPVIPGHEIAGVVEWVGANVTKLSAGDHAGVGCMVDSCLGCEYCDISEEQYCDKACTWTYGSDPVHGRAGKVATRGGYSSRMVVNEHFVVKVPKELPMEFVGPILCAGITTYDPLVHFKAGSAHVKRVGIIGGGGLGMFGIKLAKALGCEVTAITTSPSKVAALKELGATRVVVSTDEQQMKDAARSQDLILNTIAVAHEVMHYHPLLRPNGNIVQLGLVPQAHSVVQLPLLGRRAGITGSCVGGMAATQSLVDLCARDKIYPEVEVVPCSQVDKVYDELLGKATNPKRFVLDIAGTMDQFYAEHHP
eukprot:TRINITY_DN4844_c0_g1_i1.p1 TRINITY_DN4844_c0_g1~~TRINITY_DN4844_c0_g1_i1.p1  ORF type:complete len:370 (+),score=145.07 TRINITY_DN4844_c0_g1_i1:116-1225(+)